MSRREERLARYTTSRYERNPTDRYETDRLSHSNNNNNNNDNSSNNNINISSTVEERYEHNRYRKGDRNYREREEESKKRRNDDNNNNRNDRDRLNKSNTHHNDYRYYYEEEEEQQQRGRYNRDYRNMSNRDIYSRRDYDIGDVRDDDNNNNETSNKFRKDNDRYSRSDIDSGRRKREHARDELENNSYSYHHHRHHSSSNNYPDSDHNDGDNINNSNNGNTKSGVEDRSRHEEAGKREKQATSVSHKPHKRNRSSERTSDEGTRTRVGKKFEEVNIEELLRSTMPQLTNTTSLSPQVSSSEPQIETSCSVAESDTNHTITHENEETHKEMAEGAKIADDNNNNNNNNNNNINTVIDDSNKPDICKTSNNADVLVDNNNDNVKAEMNSTEVLLQLLQQHSQQQEQQQQQFPSTLLGPPPLMNSDMQFSPMMPFVPTISPFMPPMPPFFAPSLPIALSPQPDSHHVVSPSPSLVVTTTTATTATNANEAHESSANSNTSPSTTPQPQSTILQRQLPSVEDFVPVVPRSLIGLIHAPASQGVLPRPAISAPSLDGFLTGTNLLVTNEQQQQQQWHITEQLDGNVAHNENNTLNISEPRLSLYAQKLGREARRVHISGFPQHTVREELMDFFRLLIPDIRRVMTSREMRELALAAGDDEEDIRQIPSNAFTDLDVIDELNVHLEKSRPYGFLEMSLADIVTEMIDECARDSERFRFTCTADNKTYPIIFRRPRDYKPLDGWDERTLVMIGYPSSLPEDKLRAVFENFGPLDWFESKDGRTCATFQEIDDAHECRLDFHGECLGSHMDDLPNNLLSITYSASTITNTTNNTTNNSNDSIYSKALVLKNSTGQLIPLPPHAQLPPIDLMKDLLEMKVSVPLVVLRLIRFYGHLRPRFGSYHVSLFPTRILVLLNLFDEEELITDESYSSLVEEIESEVEKYGLVEELIIPRREGKPRAPNVPKREDYITTTTTTTTTTTDNSNNNNNNTEEETVKEVSTNRNDNDNGEAAYAEALVEYERAKQKFQDKMTSYLDRQIHPVWGGYGRVYVVYSTVDEAAAAQQAIAGKLFSQRTVITSFLFEDLLYPVTAAAAAATTSTNATNKNVYSNNDTTNAVTAAAVGESNIDESEQEEELHRNTSNTDGLQDRSDSNNSGSNNNNNDIGEDDELEALMNDVDADDLD